MHYLFDMRPERPGYRLQRLELLNWGTFDSTDGHVYRFEPAGRTSLLVGHNGSGKSTLVDAVLTLLVEPRTRNYNVAAGARKTERTEKSYIRGAYARTSDDANAALVKYLRPQGANLTALAAVFADEQLGKSFTLCQVLHLTADGSTDKLFAIADETRELQHDLAGVRQADAIAEHLQKLGYTTTKKFVQYRSWLTRRTGMLPKAMDMFNQTVAVKDIQSLNDFIRTHMLQRHDWQEKVRGLLAHFHDLSTAHQQLVRARRAVELLEPVEKLGRRYREQSTALASRQRQLAAADRFFRQQTIELFEPEIAARETELAARDRTIERLKSEQQSTAEQLRLLRNELDQAGGDRLRAIPQLMEVEHSRLERKTAEFERYRALLKRAGVDQEVGSAETLDKVRSQLQATAAACGEERRQLQGDYDALVVERGGCRDALRRDQVEFDKLVDRTTNVPQRLATLRDQLCRDLNLPAESLPFAAELMSVDPEERRWEASIEMVLRNFALSLLVPAAHAQQVRDYIDRTRLADARGEGQRLDYLLVGNTDQSAGDRVRPQSIAAKLVIRERHPLASWVRGEVMRRFDYQCCESVEEFGQWNRLAVTENRHVKHAADRHTKDDRHRAADRRHFVLGWDNREKQRLVAERIESRAAKVAELDDRIATHADAVEHARLRREAAVAALDVADFDSIDVVRHQRELESLAAERRQLESSNSAVKALNDRLQQTETASANLQGEYDNAIRDQARLGDQIANGHRMVSTAREMIAAAKPDEFAEQAAAFDAIATSLAAPLTAENLFETERTWTSRTRGEIDRMREPLEQLGERLIEAMSRFLREFKEEQADLDASRHSLDSFLGLLAQIRSEDLPRHEQKFKDRLNDKVTQEVALFHASLTEERRRIEDKIGQLNKALGQLEYRPGTFMKLEPRPVADREIDDFRRALRDCLDESFDGSSEANEARFLRIEKLVSRLGDSEKTRWRDKVVDVRNWYNFAAREIDKATGETQSFHEGSSGQSGGEKAKLAFTILVAAIAYQYDLDPTGMTPGRFHFVVVDEMFSKIDDQNAEYALRLFEQFGLQLLIVAPLDAKARVTEPFVDSYLQVVKDESTGRSQLLSMTAREYEDVVQQFASGNASAGRRMSAK